ncbi:dephospho-CoA kinase [Planctomycetota bacterium]|nr:dephospho-CoA kinase [Planctomycetota bacterium]
MPNKPIIALTGGVASGKSAVAAAFARRRAEIVDADFEGHEVLRDPETRAELVKTFGAEILTPEGEIDRAALGAAVFGKKHLLMKLNAITHPRIHERTTSKIERALADDAIPAIILDVSLLLESGAYNGTFSLLLFVDSSELSRENRAQGTRGWPKGELARRQAHQMSLETKRAKADIVIDNSGTLEELDRQVAAIWEEYINRATGGSDL